MFNGDLRVEADYEAKKATLAVKTLWQETSMPRRTEKNKWFHQAIAVAIPDTELRDKHFLQPQAIVICVTVLLVYAYAPFCGWIWDDDAYVYSNSLLSSWSGLGYIWTAPKLSPQYYPFLFTTFWIEKALLGDSPWHFHLVNVFLHAINSILIWRLLQKLRVPLAIVGGLWFAIHPIHVESVAWVTERKNTLSAFFYLSSLLLLLKSDGFGQEIGKASKVENRIRHVIALLSFVAGLLCKSVIATLPAVYIVIIWMVRKKFCQNDLLRIAPFFLVGVLAGLNTAYLERYHVGATGEEWNLSLFERLQLSGGIVCHYVRYGLLPFPLMFFYQKWDIAIASFVMWVPLIASVIPLLIPSAFGESLRRVKLFYIMFLGTQFPVLGFLNVYPFRFSYVADHFMYIGTIFFICMVLTAIEPLMKVLKNKWVFIYVLILCVCGIGFASVTAARVPVFKDAETLWRDTVQKNNGASAAYQNLGMIYLREGRYEDAEYAFKDALRTGLDADVVYSNLAKLRFELGDVPGAKLYLERALAIDPRSAPALLNCGIFAAREGNYAEAVSRFEQSIVSGSGYDGYFRLGLCHYAFKKYGEAALAFSRSLQFRPTDFDARYNLAQSLVALGHRAEAEALLRDIQADFGGEGDLSEEIKSFSPRP